MSVVLAGMAFAAPSQAALHAWQLNEVYSNNSGSLQFIELFSPAGNQNFVPGGQIQILNSQGTQVGSYTITGGNLPGNTQNHFLLFGTAGIHAAGGPTPDYIIPNGFLPTDGGTINFFGSNSGTFDPLPTDGTLSRTWTGGDEVNSPTNYLFATGQVAPVPEPAATMVAAGGLYGLYHLARRRARRSRDSGRIEPVRG